MLAESVARARAAASQVSKDTSKSWPEAPKIAVDWTAMTRQPEKKCFLDSYAPADIAEAEAQRATLNVVIESDPAGQGQTPAPLRKFTDLTILPEWMSWALSENKWEAPMPIQAQALPILLSGRNLIGIAQTGSGKTIAFLIPMVIHASAQRRLSRSEPGPIGLCLAPTRELAVQISDQADLLCKYSWKASDLPGGMRSVCFYGGGKKADQMKSFTFDGSHIVVATPGRLLDFCGEKRVSLTRVTYLVLDEADRMLEMGFQGDMEQISSAIRPERQTAFFSATWSKEVQALAVAFCTETPVTIRVGGNQSSGNEDALIARKGITQQVVVLDFPEEEKPWVKQEEEKNKILDAHIKKVFEDRYAKMILFVNQKNFADELSEKLYNEGIYVDTLHGGRRQEDRLAVLDKFRQGQVSLLIATDVMGRGLDVQGVTHVVVYSMGGVDDYIHRIGRTGRGKDAKGHALVFFEYSPKYPDWAKDLIAVLEQSEQPVPPELRQIAEDVASGKRASNDSWSQSSWGRGGSWKSNSGGRGSWGSGGSSEWTNSSWDNKGSAKNLTDSGISSDQISSAQFVAWGNNGTSSGPPPPSQLGAPPPPPAQPPSTPSGGGQPPPPPPQFGTQPPAGQLGGQPPPPPPQLGAQPTPQFASQPPPPQFGGQPPVSQLGGQQLFPPSQFGAQQRPPPFGAQPPPPQFGSPLPTSQLGGQQPPPPQFGAQPPSTFGAQPPPPQFGAHLPPSHHGGQQPLPPSQFGGQLPPPPFGAQPLPPQFGSQPSAPQLGLHPPPPGAPPMQFGMPR